MASYGHVAAEDVGRSSGRKKKLVTIGVSSLILVAMVVAVAVGVTRNKGDGKSNTDGGPKTSSKMIDTFCKPTDYQEACKESIADAGNATNPQQLVLAAFNYTIKRLGDAAKNSSTIKDLAEDPRSKAALENCKELLDYAVDDLRKTLDRVDGFDLTKIDDILDDLQIWLSASITYQETCLDGFENTTSDAGEHMKQALNNSMALSSNALAIATNLTSLFGNLGINFKRRLLSEEAPIPESNGYPSWVSDDRRGLLESASRPMVTPDVTVAKDGSGKYKTITEALNDVPPNGNKTFIIYIKEGVYDEHLIVEKSMTHVMFMGDGPTKTKITGNKNFIDGTTTFKSATVGVVGDYFMARDIGFENSAGAVKHQAVALRVQSDMSIFYNCQMDGYQDTLYTHTHRQFYRDCVISGTIDFIFGDAAVIFQNCQMVVRKPMDNQQCIVTAQGRKDKRQPTGIVLQDCHITADPEYFPVRMTLKSYLGRPWKEFSRTVIMYTTLDDLIAPEGWLPWLGDFGLDTCFYAEINNKGPGAALDKRVKWKGIKTIDPAHATSYTANKFIQGNTWVPTTGVPYDAGLTI